MFKRIVSFIITLSLIISSVPLAFAEGTAKSAQDRTIYKSDVYYSYSSFLEQSNYLDNYYSNILPSLQKIEDEFYNSIEYEGVALKTAVSNLTDLTYIIKGFTDLFGVTKFNYNDALTCANEEFAKYLIIADEEAYKNESDLPKALKDMLKRLSNCEKIYDELDELFGNDTLEDAIPKLSELLKKYKLPYIDDSMQANLEVALIEQIEGIKALEVGADTMEFLTGIYGALAIENTRLEIIEAIYNNSPEDSDLRNGMELLKNQLTDGFADYFIGNYITNKLLNIVTSNVIEKMLSSSDEAFNTKMNIITAVAQLGADIVFTGIFGIPDVEDIFKVITLNDYMSQFKDSITTKAASFSKQFDAGDVSEFELMLTSVSALANASYSASEKIVIGSTKELYKSIADCIECDVYDSVYNETVAEIQSKTDEELKEIRNRYDCWITTVEDDTEYYIELVPSSNDIEDNKIYCTDNTWNGNLYMTNFVTDSRIRINEGDAITVSGDVNITESLLSGSAYMQIDGTLNINGCLYVDYLTLNGNLDVDGLLDAFVLTMNSADAKLYAGGDFTLHNSLEDTASGTIILDGDETYQLFKTDIIPKDISLIVKNKNGIQYSNDIEVSGSYYLCGNPLETNGNYTKIISSDATIDSISDYKELHIYTDWDIKHNITGIIHTVAGITVSVPYGTNAVINGEFVLGSHSNFNINGNLTITEKLEIGWNTSFTNKTFLNMSESCATLTLLGDFIADDIDECNITDGTVIFAGDKQQQIQNLSAHNLTVINKAGVKYLTDVYVSGHFALNGYNIDNDDDYYYTVIHGESASLDDISDYKLIEIGRETVFNLEQNITADITIGREAKLIIPKEKSSFVDGDITISDYATLQIDGNLTVKGNIGTNSSISSTVYFKIADQGVLDITGNLNSSHGGFNPESGTIIFSGDTAQITNIYNVDTVIIKNTSTEGVAFENKISVKKLFDHQGNNFTLITPLFGSNSFVDFDGDTILDNLDEEPTVFDKKFYYNKVCNVNGDNATNVKDLVRIKKKLAENNTDSIYDINKDSDVSSSDMLIVRMVLLNDYSFHK